MKDDASSRWSLSLVWLPAEFAICRLPADAPVPGWAERPGGFHSVTRTDDELSIICDARAVPESAACTRAWRLGRIEGRFPHDATGVLAAIVGPLADAGVSVFANATFDTDYILVQAAQLDLAVRTLTAAGHSVRGV